MRVAVMAAGGLGGYLGGVLAHCGHEVSFIARGAHLQAMRNHGLTIKSGAGDFQLIPVKATDQPAEIGPVDWVLFAVKAYDNPTAIQAMRPLVGGNTLVISVQNGVTAHEELAEAFGMQRVIVAPIQIASNITAPGVIEQKSPFRNMVVGEVGGTEVTPRVQQIVTAFKTAGVEASAAPDGLVPLWDKLIFLASIAGLASLARTEPHALFAHQEAAAVLREAMEEVYRVARAWDIALDEQAVERRYEFAMRIQPGVKPSMQLDLEAGKRLEIDALSGAVVRLGAEKGVPTPVHRTIFAALKREDERALSRLSTAQ